MKRISTYQQLRSNNKGEQQQHFAHYECHLALFRPSTRRSCRSALFMAFCLVGPELVAESSGTGLTGHAEGHL